MHHPSYVHWAYSGEDVFIPSSRGSGNLNFARFEHCALNHRLVLSVRQCIYASAPVNGAWPFHVATLARPSYGSWSESRPFLQPPFRGFVLRCDQQLAAWLCALSRSCLSETGRRLHPCSCHQSACRHFYTGSPFGQKRIYVSARGGCDKLLCPQPQNQ